MKGRKPIPDNLRLLHGTKAKRARGCAPRSEPAGATLLHPPDDLTPGAAAVWSELARPLAAAGITTARDLTALRLIAETYTQWKRATLELAQGGLTCVMPSGAFRPSPWFRIQINTSELLIRLLSKFGMTLSSRTRVRSARAPEDPDAVDLFGF